MFAIYCSKNSPGKCSIKQMCCAKVKMMERSFDDLVDINCHILLQFDVTLFVTRSKLRYYEIYFFRPYIFYKQIREAAESKFHCQKVVFNAFVKRNPCFC